MVLLRCRPRMLQRRWGNSCYSLPWCKKSQGYLLRPTGQTALSPELLAKPSQYMVTAGTSAGLEGRPGHSEQMKLQLTFLDFSPFLPVFGTLWQTSCLRTRIGHSQQSWEIAVLWHGASLVQPSPRAHREAAIGPRLVSESASSIVPLWYGELENIKTENWFKKRAAQTRTLIQNRFSFFTKHFINHPPAPLHFLSPHRRGHLGLCLCQEYWAMLCHGAITPELQRRPL